MEHSWTGKGLSEPDGAFHGKGTRGSLAWLSLFQQLDEESDCCGACGSFWGSSAELDCSLGSQADRLSVPEGAACPSPGSVPTLGEKGTGAGWRLQRKIGGDLVIEIGFKSHVWLIVVVHTHNPSTRKVEAGDQFKTIFHYMVHPRLALAT